MICICFLYLYSYIYIYMYIYIYSFIHYYYKYAFSFMGSTWLSWSHSTAGPEWLAWVSLATPELGMAGRAISEPGPDCSAGELRGSSPRVAFDRFSSPGCPNVPNNLEGCSSQESACAFCHKRSHTWRIWWRPWGLKKKTHFITVPGSPSHPPTPLRCHGLKYKKGVN